MMGKNSGCRHPGVVVQWYSGRIQEYTTVNVFIFEQLRPLNKNMIQHVNTFRQCLTKANSSFLQNNHVQHNTYQV